MKIKYTLPFILPLLLTACAGNVQHRWCPPQEVVQAVPAVPVVSSQLETIHLSGDELFKFDRSGINDMLPGGRESLDRLAQSVQSNYLTIEKIDITGHTDRLGSEAYNLRLGMERAESVKVYLQQHGIESEINARSQGESEPRTTNCPDSLGREQLKVCLQADRRVTLDILGVKHQ